MFVAALQEMHPGIIKMEPKGQKVVRTFSTREKAECWLKVNCFYYGCRPFFDYEDNAQEWCHEKDVSWNFVDVSINEYAEDDESDSVFKDFIPDLAPWHKAAREEGRRQGFI